MDLYEEDYRTTVIVWIRRAEEEMTNPLKPEKGENYTGTETGTIYEWDGINVLIQAERKEAKKRVKTKTWKKYTKLKKVVT